MKGFGKFLKAILWILIILLLTAAGIRAWVVFSTKNSVQDAYTAAGTRAETIIVLGAGVYRDGTLSPILKNRLDKALELWNAGAADTVLVTGDHRLGEYDEVDHMAAYLIENGVPQSVILEDYNGYSTYESMYRARYLYHIKDAVVVTQRYHIYRAMYIGRNYGMSVRGTAAEDAGTSAGKLKRGAREWAATCKDLASCLLQVSVDISEGQ